MIKKKINQCDLFGEQVELNLDGKTQHTTWFGGVVSIFLIVVMSLIFYSDLKILIEYSGDTVGLHYEMLDSDKIKPVNINKNNYLPTIILRNATKPR